MQSETPKQFLPLLDKPILLHTIENFSRSVLDINIILVLPKQHISTWQTLTKNFLLPRNILIVPGGETRYQSVKNGLQYINEEGVIGVQDAVRPFVSQRLIFECYTAAEKSGTAIPCVPLKDSIRKISDDNSEIIDRILLRSIQTPQCFRASILKKAYIDAPPDNYTDDAGVVEKSGEKLNLVMGDEWNFKITTPADYQLAQQLINIHLR
jgi:2-C-methyl-D-erythritol 4-phosphate cytidylyltransferase